MDPALATICAAVRADLADLGRDRLVLVAVSGGADSLALAVATATAAPRLGLRAGAVTVDHGLQAGSELQAEKVAATCLELGLAPVEVRRVAVGTDGGPEAAARSARYAALDATAADHDAAAVLLGHTRDDQAETVLVGLARGSGARSLSGMPRRRGIYRRPLLDVPREVTRAACAACGVDPWEDPHNADPAYLRSRVRAGVMPALEAALGPGAAAALARSADLLRADADALDGYAAAVTDPSDVRALGALPPAVRSRVLRRAAIAAGAAAGALTAAHVAEIDRLVTDWRGQGPVSLPGGLVARRSCDRLLFR